MSFNDELIKELNMCEQRDGYYANHRKKRRNKLTSKRRKRTKRFNQLRA